MHGDTRSQKLFVVLAAFFCVNAVLAEFIGVKIFALEDTLGLAPFEWNLFGQTGSLSFTAVSTATRCARRSLEATTTNCCSRCARRGAGACGPCGDRRAICR